MQKELSFTDQTLSLITRPSLQSCALSQSLKKTLRMNSKIINIHTVNQENVSQGIVLFDMIEIDKKLIKAWQEELCKINSGVKLLLFNTPEDYAYQDIESWPHIHGIFYAHLSLIHISEPTRP